MAAIPALHSWFPTKDGHKRISIATGNSEQCRFTGCLKVRNSGLNQMTGAIKFVSMPQISPTSFWFDHSIMWIQIPIGLLCGGNQGNHFIEQGVKFRIRHARQAITSRLDPFRDIRIPELMGGMLISRLPIQAIGIETTSLLTHVINMRN